MPPPQAALDPACRLVPGHIHRVDHEQRDDNRNGHVAQDGDRRREEAEQGPVGVHSSDVNRKERRDKRTGPAEINRGPRSFARFDLRSDRYRRRLVGQTELFDDSLVRLRGRVDGRDHHGPGDAEYSQGPGDCDPPRHDDAADQQQEHRDRGVAERGQRSDRALPRIGGAERRNRIADRIHVQTSRRSAPSGPATRPTAR